MAQEVWHYLVARISLSLHYRCLFELTSTTPFSFCFLWRLFPCAYYLRHSIAYIYQRYRNETQMRYYVSWLCILYKEMLSRRRRRYWFYMVSCHGLLKVLRFVYAHVYLSAKQFRSYTATRRRKKKSKGRRIRCDVIIICVRKGNDSTATVHVVAYCMLLRRRAHSAGTRALWLGGVGSPKVRLMSHLRVWKQCPRTCNGPCFAFRRGFTFRVADLSSKRAAANARILMRRLSAYPWQTVRVALETNLQAGFINLPRDLCEISLRSPNFLVAKDSSRGLTRWEAFWARLQPPSPHIRARIPAGSRSSGRTWNARLGGLRPRPSAVDDVGQFIV